MHNRRDYRPLRAKLLPCHHLYVYVTFVLLNFIDVGVTQAAHVIKSPDGNVALTFDVRNIGNQLGCPIYGVAYKSRPIVIESRLGFALEDAPALEAGFDIVSVTGSSNDTTYSPVYGERKTIRNHYNQLVLELKETAQPHLRLRPTFRAYDEGAAFCYTFPRQNSLKSFTISTEETQFRFCSDHTAWAACAAQNPYVKVPLGKIRSNCERPLTIEIEENGPFVSVAEARLVDYARMRFAPDKDQPYAVVSMLGSPVKVDTPYTTPWRVLLLADNPH